MTDEYETGKGVGVKYDKGKPRMTLVPHDVLMSVAGVFTYGAEKYTDDNWAEGMRWRRMGDAMERHFAAWLHGEDMDDESGLHHLDHALCCLMMLRGMVLREKGDDDRWKI